jgi:hypothetical protein
MFKVLSFLIQNPGGCFVQFRLVLRTCTRTPFSYKTDTKAQVATTLCWEPNGICIDTSCIIAKPKNKFSKIFWLKLEPILHVTKIILRHSQQLKQIIHINNNEHDGYHIAQFANPWQQAYKWDMNMWHSHQQTFKLKINQSNSHIWQRKSIIPVSPIEVKMHQLHIFWYFNFHSCVRSGLQAKE